MSRSKFNNDIYDMYEKEYNKNLILRKENKNLKLEILTLKYELKYIEKSANNKIKKELEKEITPLVERNKELEVELNKAYKEIERLKNQIMQKENKDKYTIDKLTNQVNKNSTNSSIPTSKEMSFKREKTGPNTYNHREKALKKQEDKLVIKVKL